MGHRIITVPVAPTIVLSLAIALSFAHSSPPHHCYRPNALTFLPGELRMCEPRETHVFYEVTIVERLVNIHRFGLKGIDRTGYDAIPSDASLSLIPRSYRFYYLASWSV